MHVKAEDIVRPIAGGGCTRLDPPKLWDYDRPSRNDGAMKDCAGNDRRQ